MRKARPILIGVGLLIATIAAVFGQTPSFQCVISQNGMRWDIFGTNTSNYNLKCDYVRCDMFNKDGTPTKGECQDARLLHGETNKLLCGNGPDNTLNLSQVIGVSHCCTPE
jgi:hypothetical protein